MESLREIHSKCLLVILQRWEIILHQKKKKGEHKEDLRTVASFVSCCLPQYSLDNMCEWATCSPSKVAKLQFSLDPGKMANGESCMSPWWWYPVAYHLLEVHTMVAQDWWH